MHFELKPKDKKITDVTSLKLDVEGQDLKAFSYLDTLENEVSFSFEGLKEQKIPVKKFHYEPPKGAEVTDL